MWFLQVETQFKLRGIKSDSTKFDHLLAALPTESMEIIADLLTSPPIDDKYKELKKLLISRCQDTEFYRHLEGLAGDNNLINKELLKKIWLSKLPANIQPCVIAIEGTKNNEQMFLIADKIL